ncbi:hypothetical protein IPJ91_01950 [bacterium]|nr:MAG: hypothetical protein IPJ91_01950 [bacterium]
MGKRRYPKDQKSFDNVYYETYGDYRDNVLYPKGAWSYQKIFQTACVVKSQQEQYKKAGQPVNLMLRECLLFQIIQKGGINAIDAWLKKNDPGHYRLRDIANMDWSWLDESR